MEEHLIIDWEKIHLYNSLMAVTAGAALLSIWWLFSRLTSEKKMSPKGVALNFGVLGLILFITGVHTTLTWPLSPTYPFDNSIFGEPCFVFGALLLAMAFYFWKEKDIMLKHSEKEDNSLLNFIANDFNEFRFIIMGVGLAVVMMGAAGIQYKIFLAPPEEPIVGAISKSLPYYTSYLVGLLWISVGVAALGITSFFKSVVEHKKRNYKWLKILMLVVGINFMSIGVITYFTHVGMIINTMDPATIKPNVIGQPDEAYYPNKN